MAAEWDAVLESAARLQQLVPDAVIVAGTASAMHARHRVSFDHDHVLGDLRFRFDAVLEALEATDGWVTARVQAPVLNLGSLDGVETGIRQLIRERPVEVEEIAVPGGIVRAPTLPEAIRLEAWLILRRNATRDYLDLAALTDHFGEASVEALRSMDEFYADQIGPDDDRIASQLIKQLEQPMPYDLTRVDLEHYRGLAERWQDWSEVELHLRLLANKLTLVVVGSGGADAT